MFCEIEVCLFIPLHKRDRVAETNLHLLFFCCCFLLLFYFNSLKTIFSLSRFLFFIQEVDQSVGSFPHHHACV